MLVLGNQVGKILVWDLTVDEPNKLKYSCHFSCVTSCLPTTHAHYTHTPYHPLPPSPHTSHIHTPHTHLTTLYPPLHTHHTSTHLTHTLPPSTPLSAHITHPYTSHKPYHPLSPSPHTSHTHIHTPHTPTHLTDLTLYHIQSVSQPLDKSPSAKTERKDLRAQRSMQTSEIMLHGVQARAFLSPVFDGL